LINPGLRDREKLRKTKGEVDVDRMVGGRIQYLACKEYHCGSLKARFP
jgi:hypothetical protein